MIAVRSSWSKKTGPVCIAFLQSPSQSAADKITNRNMTSCSCKQAIQNNFLAFDHIVRLHCLVATRELCVCYFCYFTNNGCMPQNKAAIPVGALIWQTAEK